ncbi:unnamed protein product [Ixodes pacificus]
MNSADAFFINSSVWILPSLVQAPLFSPNSTSAINFAGLGHIIGQQTILMMSQFLPRDEGHTASSALEEKLRCIGQLQNVQGADGRRWTRNVTIEDLADVISLQAAYSSFPREGRHLGKTPSEEKLFFAASCFKFCEAKSERNVTGPGTPKARCNVPLMNVAAFAHEFHCSTSSSMNPAKKCAIL